MPRIHLGAEIVHKKIIHVVPCVLELLPLEAVLEKKKGRKFFKKAKKRRKNYCLHIRNLMCSSIWSDVSEGTDTTMFGKHRYLSFSLHCLTTWTIFKVRTWEPQNRKLGKCEAGRTKVKRKQRHKERKERMEKLIKKETEVSDYWNGGWDLCARNRFSDSYRANTVENDKRRNILNLQSWFLCSVKAEMCSFYIIWCDEINISNYMRVLLLRTSQTKRIVPLFRNIRLYEPD